MKFLLLLFSFLIIIFDELFLDNFLLLLEVPPNIFVFSWIEKGLWKILI
jgi:hypothetical protein